MCNSRARYANLLFENKAIVPSIVPLPFTYGRVNYNPLSPLDAGYKKNFYHFIDRVANTTGGAVQRKCVKNTEIKDTLLNVPTVFKSTEYA